MQQDFDVHAGMLRSSANRRLCFAGSSWRALLQRHSSLFIPPGQRSAAAPTLICMLGFMLTLSRKRQLLWSGWERFPRSRGRGPRGWKRAGLYFTWEDTAKRSRRWAAASHRSALQVQAIPDKSLAGWFLEKPNECKEAVKSEKRRRKWALQRGRKIKARGDNGGESRGGGMGGFQGRRNLIC